MEYQDYRIFSHWNRQAFLHVEYPYQGDPEFNKIKFWSGKVKDEHVELDSTHYLDYADLRYWIFEILRGLEPGQELVSVKGKPDPTRPIARVMKIRRDAKEDNKYFIIIGHGPGIAGDNGSIVPDPRAPKQAWTFTPIMFYEHEIMALALTLQSYLNAITSTRVWRLNMEVSV